MNVGIIRFPGSNCDYDTYRWFKEAEHNPFFIFHNSFDFDIKADLIVLPGGFAFGDRLYKNATSEYTTSPGTQALNSPVMEYVFSNVDKVPILGICNGFQILTQAELLPGTLEINSDRTFVCDNMICKFSDGSSGFSFFNTKRLGNLEMNIPIAHGYGRYVCPEDVSKANPFLFYKHNPNGSMFSIAGVCNDNRTIWGMMPHPERSPGRDILMQAIEEEIEWI